MAIALRVVSVSPSTKPVKPGDRIKFVPCSVEEFNETEAQVAAGTYVYNVVGYQKFSVRQYSDWLATVDASKRF